MAGFKNLPELVQINGRWVLDGFEPGQAAFKWSDYQRKSATLYILKCGEYLKIGITRDMDKRLKQIDAANPMPVVKIATKTVPLAGVAFAEAWLHRELQESRVKGEWFAIDEKTALSLLPEAARRAAAYSRCCQDWHARELAREMNG